MFSCSDDLYSSFVYSQSCKSLYIPTPRKKLWEHRISVEVPIPDSLCFLELRVQWTSPLGSSLLASLPMASISLSSPQLLMYILCIYIYIYIYIYRERERERERNGGKGREFEFVHLGIVYFYRPARTTVKSGKYAHMHSIF